MTRRVVVTLVLVLVSLAGMIGCGDDRLTVAGFARFDSGDAFEFPNDIRIDSGGTTTGTCTVTGAQVDGVIRRSVIVDIYRGVGSEQRSLTVMAADHEAGSIDAGLQTGMFGSTEACAVAATYTEESGSVTLDSTDCTLTNGDGTSTVLADVHLELHGCRVQ